MVLFLVMNDVPCLVLPLGPLGRCRSRLLDSADMAHQKPNLLARKVCS